MPNSDTAELRAPTEPPAPRIGPVRVLAGLGLVVLAGSLVLALAGTLAWPWAAGALTATGTVLAAELWRQAARRDGDRGRFEQSRRDLQARLSTQVKDSLKKSRNLEALISAMDEALLATDNAECVLLCNTAAERVLGCPAPGPDSTRAISPLVGRPVVEVFTHAELIDMHRRARAGELVRARIPLTTSQGVRVFQVSASPVPVAWGEGIFGAVLLLRDVTELDQAVQVKTDLVANASHELRTPVAAIRAAADTLRTVARDDPAMAQRVAGMVISHAQRLEELVRDLLDLSRLESPDVHVHQSPVLAEGLRAGLQQLFEVSLRDKRLTLRFEIEPELTEFLTDPRLLNLILRNLIENSVKFAFEGTEITVAWTLVEAEQDEAGRPIAGVARLEVTDKGVGIPLQHQDRVFERFFQVDPARTGGGKRGTGLGLAIVKHAVKTLHGRVGLTSVWGQGTTVWVELPIHFPPTPSEQRQSIPA